MRKRYGQTNSVHRDRRAPRGGQRNDQRDLLAELDEELETENEREVQSA
jgi:hypothetical protein